MLAGCVPELAADLSRVDAARVLAVRAEPAEAGQGEQDRVAYERALAALDEAMIVANTDPEQGIVLLARALAALLLDAATAIEGWALQAEVILGDVPPF